MIAPDADQVKISICGVSAVRSIRADLARRVDDDVAAGQRGRRDVHALDRRRPLLDEAHDLVELGHEEVERRQDAAVRAEVVPARRQRRPAELAAEHPMLDRRLKKGPQTHCFMTSL